ncbi:MAG: NAD(P)H-dependent oxidoreductase subunit E [Dehalococcoidales bacterium]
MHTAEGKIDKKVASILDRYENDSSMLVSILQDIQEEYNYLPRESLEQVSRTMDVPLSRLYSIATFFKALRLTPRGRHLINVCMGTACHVRGSVKVLEAIERELDVERGGTTEDLGFTLETVNCVGACALGPVVIVDGEYHGQMRSEKVKDMIKQYS